MRAGRYSHVVFLAAESAVLLALLAYAIGQILPAQRWAYSQEPSELSFAYASGQDKLLEGLRSCKIYYATYATNHLCDAQTIVDRNPVFDSQSRHAIMLPAGVTQFRIDFYPKDKDQPDLVQPKLSWLKLGESEISLGQLHPFCEQKLRFTGYSIRIDPFMNGWWRVNIPIAGLIWLVALIGGWYYFVRTTLCDE